MATTNGHSAISDLGAVLDAIVDGGAIKITIKDAADNSTLVSQYTLVGSGVGAVSVLWESTGRWLLSYVETGGTLHRQRSTVTEPGSSDWTTLF